MQLRVTALDSEGVRKSLEQMLMEEKIYFKDFLVTIPHETKWHGHTENKISRFFTESQYIQW